MSLRPRFPEVSGGQVPGVLGANVLLLALTLLLMVTIVAWMFREEEDDI